MTKEEIYQRMLDCRLIADEVYDATILLPNAKERFEVSWCAEKVNPQGAQGTQSAHG